MARPKKGEGPPKGAKNKAREGPGFRTIGVRVTDAYAAWLERAAKHSRSTVSTFLDRAAANQARADGFTDPPPERLP